jgi:hypothetical protein
MVAIPKSFTRLHRAARGDATYQDPRSAACLMLGAAPHS